MPDSYQIVFLGAGDSTSAAQRTVAEKIASASKTPVDKLLKQIEAAPFIYKRGLPRAKADAISATLNRLGGKTEVTADGTPLPTKNGEDFELETPSASGSFDFDAAPSANAESSGSFDPFAGSSEPPASSSSSFDFQAAESSEDAGFSFGGGGGEAAAPSSGSGFDFSVDSAVTGGDEVDMTSSPQVESNLDYAESAGGESADSHGPPPVSGTVTCPRCHADVPPADECASCGVLMAKADASTDGDTGVLGAGGQRRPRARAAKKKGSMAPLIAAAVVVVGLVAAFLGGAFNPIRLNLAAGGNDLLSEYDVSVASPDDGVVTAEVNDSDMVTELSENLVARSQQIEATIDELGGLDQLDEFDRRASELQPDIDAYLAEPGAGLWREVSQVAGSLYEVKGVGLDIGGTTYSFREYMPEGGGRIERLLNDVDIRRGLEAARKQVGDAEKERLSNDFDRTANVPFEDEFESGFSKRWQGTDDPGLQIGQGWLYMTARPGGPGDGPRLLFSEPTADYEVEVVVAGDSTGSARAGLIVHEGGGRYVMFGRARDRRGRPLIQVFTGDEASDKPAAETERIKISKRGRDYTFSRWGGQRWEELDSFRPFGDEATVSVGLAAFGGGDTFFFDSFRLNIISE